MEETMKRYARLMKEIRTETAAMKKEIRALIRENEELRREIRKATDGRGIPSASIR